MIDASWVIVDRTTGKPVLETWNFELVQFINIKRYRVFTAHAWMCSLNLRPLSGQPCIWGGSSARRPGYAGDRP